MCRWKAVLSGNNAPCSDACVHVNQMLVPSSGNPCDLGWLCQTPFFHFYFSQSGKYLQDLLPALEHCLTLQLVSKCSQSTRWTMWGEEKAMALICLFLLMWKCQPVKITYCSIRVHLFSRSLALRVSSSFQTRVFLQDMDFQNFSRRLAAATFWFPYN